jgi:hypothetical protein
VSETDDAASQRALDSEVLEVTQTAEANRSTHGSQRGIDHLATRNKDGQSSDSFPSLQISSY